MTTYYSPTIKVPTVQSTHSPKGTYKQFGDVKAYSVGSIQLRKAVIVAHDMMGFTSRAEQLCDIISEQGYRVVMPNLFRQCTVETQGREKNPQLFFTYMAEIAPDDHTTKIIDQVVLQLRSEGVSYFGVFGTSWGGKCAVLASHNKAFTAAVLINVPLLSVNDFANTQCPVAILMPGDLQDQTPIVQNLQSTKPFARKIVYKQFPNMRHAYVSSLGDYSNQIVAEFVTEALQTAITFFRENIGFRNY